MTTDQLSIYNGAIRHTGGNRLSSLDEINATRNHLNDVWDAGGVERCLRAAQWNWAARTVGISYSDSIAPDFGYQRAFERPTDFVRLVGVSSTPQMTRPLDHYETAGDLYFADIDTIYLRYVSKGASYGFDYSLWPADFTAYVELFFAVQIAPKVTASGVKLDELEKKLGRFLDIASGNDAMAGPSKSIPMGSWARSRSSSRGSYRGY